MPIWEQFRAGAFTPLKWKWLVPDKLGATSPYVEILFNAAITAAYSGGETTRVVGFHRVQAKNSVPPSYTQTLKVFSSSDPIDVTKTPATTHRLRFIIANADLVGKEGGIIDFEFQVTSLSTGPDFLIGEPKLKWRFGPQAPAPTGWSFD